MSSQKPLELILARNLLSSISTPAFLVGQGGTLLFYNDAAAALLGRRFEETGTMTAQEWTHEFGPVGADGTPTRSRLRRRCARTARSTARSGSAARQVTLRTSPPARFRSWARAAARAAPRVAAS
jgi:PAS domain-containing protein